MFSWSWKVVIQVGKLSMKLKRSSFRKIIQVIRKLVISIFCWIWNVIKMIKTNGEKNYMSHMSYLVSNKVKFSELQNDLHYWCWAWTSNLTRIWTLLKMSDLNSSMKNCIPIKLGAFMTLLSDHIVYVIGYILYSHEKTHERLDL